MRKRKLMKYKEISGIFLCNVVYFPLLKKQVNLNGLELFQDMG